ncbi:MAG: DUF3329 domain-containing protein [Rhodobacter sp.]|nr:hypothetical protein [Paracoccaceae bacterium]MCC0077371.1 DUF3329 domain-containing protein [Rhodobacter sp.]
MPLIDADHPFFRPLWRRVVVVAFCLGWAGFEALTQSPGWALMIGALGLYAAWVLLVDWRDPKEKDNG